MPAFADHFSSTAKAYAAFRPTYPDSLFSWLAREAPSRAAVWDCATGSGQAAGGLASHFDFVLASDASEAQVSNAIAHPHVGYAVMRAEEVAVASQSVSLVCVAQALHWFARSRFYAEALRVLVPGGLLAVWRYGLATVDPEIDAVVEEFYRETVGPWWPPERAIVEAGYATLEFPLHEIRSPEFLMHADWTLGQFGSYLGTWSAVTRYRTAVGRDPIPSLITVLAPLWGADGATRRVAWPLDLRVGRAGP